MSALVAVLLIVVTLLGAPLFAVIGAGALVGFDREGVDLSVVAIEFFGLSETPVLVAIPPALAVEHLTTRFVSRDGSVTAVDDLGFSVAAGEVLGLVGESGSGKSVTGFSILGLVDPPGEIVAGSIRLKGRELRGLPASAWRDCGA